MYCFIHPKNNPFHFFMYHNVSTFLFMSEMSARIFLKATFYSMCHISRTQSVQIYPAKHFLHESSYPLVPRLWQMAQSDRLHHNLFACEESHTIHKRLQLREATRLNDAYNSLIQFLSGHTGNVRHDVRQRHWIFTINFLCLFSHTEERSKPTVLTGTEYFTNDTHHESYLPC